MEAHHFEIRKHVLEYDLVMDHQRKVIYGLRQAIIDGRDTRTTVIDMVERVVHGMAEFHLASDDGPPDPETLAHVFGRRFEIEADPADLKGKDAFAAAILLIEK